jgi:hypothetical protein
MSVCMNVTVVQIFEVMADKFSLVRVSEHIISLDPLIYKER